MKKIQNVEQAIVFLQLCQSDDAEFNEAVEIVTQRIRRADIRLTEYRQEMRRLVQDKLDDHLLVQNIRNKELERKLNVVTRRLANINNALYEDLDD